MRLEAADVIHSFWVPEFRVKQDLVPGQVHDLRFTPTLEGDYELVCAEICGLNHYLMVKPVRIVSQAEYSACRQLIELGGLIGFVGAPGSFRAQIGGRMER